MIHKQQTRNTHFRKVSLFDTAFQLQHKEEEEQQQKEQVEQED